ncbi:hypothetical protein DO70_316 [Burkholderia pseudomallei]|nr:hypothetical protein DO70_316 [Burkholderia pseudomallei]
MSVLSEVQWFIGSAIERFTNMLSNGFQLGRNIGGRLIVFVGAEIRKDINERRTVRGPLDVRSKKRGQFRIRQIVAFSQDMLSNFVLENDARTVGMRGLEQISFDERRSENHRRPGLTIFP